MKKNLQFIVLVVLFALCGCNGGIKKQQSDLEDIKMCIVDYENKHLPLVLQQYGEVHSIVIDSLVIINNVEPYEGYLSTTWDFEQRQGYSNKYVRKTMNVLVEVTDVTIHDDDTYSWETNWFGAFNQVYMN